MLDHRVYRAAFLPALVALFVVAFSLSDLPRGETTRLAPLAFDHNRAFATVESLAERFPRRAPGSSDDLGLADLVAERLEAFSTDVRRRGVVADTIDGNTELETVVATREGLSNRSIVVIAHRDAAGAPAAAELSGTAVLLELARLFADRDLAKTIVLASVSGGSGGYAGARDVAENAPGNVDAVFVLGDLAGEPLRRPFAVPFGTGSDPAPYALERTMQSALRAELDTDPGRTRASVQFLRRAVPLSLSEQGAVNRAGLPAVLISSLSERRPAADAPIRKARVAGFGRATLRAIYAVLDADRPFPQSDGIVALKRLVPTWSIRLLVFALLVPALLTAFDGFFRARRRGAAMTRWSLWAAMFALPFLGAWLWARALDLSGAITALDAPVADGVLPLETVGWVAMASTAVVLLGAGYAVWSRSARGPQLAAGAPAAATGLMLSGLVLAVWLFNPYAAAVLLPAAHTWLLASAPGRRLRRATSIAAFVAGLVLPALVVAYYMQAWDLGATEALWTAFGLVSGGVLGLGAAVTVSVYAAALCATFAILRARRGLAEAEPAADDRLVTRGPRSYAGPGSLGGTESALRR